MSTPHNEANLGDIAKTVIMPGDPLRAKYIAENFMTDIKLVNSVRGIYAYTGKYKGKDSGRGIGFEKQDCHSHGVFGIGIHHSFLQTWYSIENEYLSI